MILLHKLTDTTMTSTLNGYGHNARSHIAKFIPTEARRVLDVGCNTGGFGEALKKERGIEVWGVEPNNEAARAASSVLDRVICQPFDASCPLPDSTFDVVAFTDVLEHFIDPWAALLLAKRKLRDGGVIVASIPNFLHQENLLHLLRDRDFKYEETGIRDKTHLRFFTKMSAQRMFIECDFTIVKVEGINSEWWSSNILRRLAYRIFSQQLEETKYIQYVIVAKPARIDG